MVYKHRLGSSLSTLELLFGTFSSSRGGHCGERWSGCSPDGVCIPLPPIGIRIHIWCLCEKVFGGHHAHEGPREPSELVMIHHQKWCCGRLTLNMTKVCPSSLPSTTQSAVLRWLLVSASLCATFCTPHYPNVASLELKEWGVAKSRSNFFFFF